MSDLVEVETFRVGGEAKCQGDRSRALAQRQQRRADRPPEGCGRDWFLRADPLALPKGLPARQRSGFRLRRLRQRRFGVRRRIEITPLHFLGYRVLEALPVALGNFQHLVHAGPIGGWIGLVGNGRQIRFVSGGHAERVEFV